MIKKPDEQFTRLAQKENEFTTNYYLNGDPPIEGLQCVFPINPALQAANMENECLIGGLAWYK